MTGIAKAVPVIDIGSSYRRTHFTGIVTVDSDMPPELRIRLSCLYWLGVLPV